MTEYFIHDGTKEKGPFTLIELSSQRITADTPIWHKGLAGWTKAKDLEELYPLLASKLSPPPFNRDNKWFRNRIIPVYLIAATILIAVSLIWYLSGGKKSGVNPAPPSDIHQDASGLAGVKKQQIETARLNREIEAMNLNYRNNWNRYIWVNHNKYKRNLLGGISNLQVWIENETEYVLDEVNISVHYIKSNGGTYKIEPLEIYNVPAHGKAFIPAPVSDRGTSVTVEINAISCKKMNFCYSRDIDIRRSKDPYRCKKN